MHCGQWYPCYSTDTTPTQPHRNSKTHRTKNNMTNVVIQQNSHKLLMMDILMSKTCWAHKKWNKIASDIKSVFYSSTIISFIKIEPDTLIKLYTYYFTLLYFRHVSTHIASSWREIQKNMYLSIQLHCMQVSTSADRIVVIILNPLWLTVCMGVILPFTINLKINHKYIHTHFQY